jgi:D-threo-aldose 1-dehydrogenase
MALATDLSFLARPLPPVEPVSRDAFFALVEPAPGLPPVRRLAVGTAGLGGALGDVDDHESVDTLLQAWRDGFCLTDTAPAYADAEHVVGAALRRWDGPPVVLGTKVGKTPHNAHDYSLAHLAAQFDESCRRFGRPPELLAVHEPTNCPPPQRPAVTEFVRRLKREGRIRAAGLGGPGAEEDTWTTGGAFDYLITFYRLGAISLQGLDDEIPRARAAGVKIFAASPMFMGVLGSRLPDLLAERPDWLAPVQLERAERLSQLAAAAGVPLPELALRFLLSLPMVDVVVAGAARPDEWAQTRAAYAAGPLPGDLFAAVWTTAQHGVEPRTGG